MIKKCMRGAVWQRRRTHDICVIIDSRSPAPGAAQFSEIFHFALTPEVSTLIGGNNSIRNHFLMLVDARRAEEKPNREQAQIADATFANHKRQIRFWKTGIIA